MIVKCVKELAIVQIALKDLMTNVWSVVGMAFVANAEGQVMLKETTNSITVKIDIELYEKARAISKLTGRKLREIIESGLKREVIFCLRSGSLNIAVNQMVEYRRGKNG